MPNFNQQQVPQQHGQVGGALGLQQPQQALQLQPSQGGQLSQQLHQQPSQQPGYQPSIPMDQTFQNPKQ